MVFGKYWMKNMKVSSKESEKHQQMGLGSFLIRNYLFLGIINSLKHKKAYNQNQYDFSCTPYYLFLLRMSILKRILT